MCLTAFALGGAALGGLFQSNAANNATNAQQDASQQQLALQKQIYNDQTQRFNPYLQSGTNALAAYNYEMGLGAAPAGYRGFQATPGYQFQLDQGMNAIQGSAAANGGLFSGATLQGIGSFSQGLANQEYGNYMNRLGGQVAGGQSAAGMQATAGSNYAAGAGQAYGNYGDATAAGAIAQGNAANNFIGNSLGALSYMQTQPLFGGNSWGL